MTTTTTKLHPFEEANLGTAPFRVAGFRVEENLTNCHFCGTRIKNVYEIEGTDRRRFDVGSDCVRLTGDSSLIDDVKKQEARLRMLRAEAKRDAERAAVRAAEAAKAEERRIAELDRALAADSARRAEEVRKANLCYLGKPGWTLKLDLVVERVMRLDGQYGESFLHVMRDPEGNRVAWFADPRDNEPLNEGERYLLSCVVKSHSEYKGEKQTTLWRVRVIS